MLVYFHIYIFFLFFNFLASNGFVPEQCVEVYIVLDFLFILASISFLFSGVW